MNFSQSLKIKFLFTPRVLGLLIAVCMCAISAAAQKSWFAPLAIGVNIEQCANGPLSAPIDCDVSSANDGYIRGNLVASKSHYFEGDFVPIRIVAEGLVVATSYTVTIGYDFTKGGKYANDYLGDYDFTESTNNNPCVGVTGCTLGSETTFPVPIDPDVTEGFDQTLGTGDDIVQIPGSFSCFGCTITAVSGYTLSGSQAGDSTKSITLTFTANQTNVVIAYGTHISTRSDWGLENSAINISGSPYHNYIVEFPGSNQGNRDLQLSAEAVIFPGSVEIIKLVRNLDGSFYNTVNSFGFTSSANFGTTSFSLMDIDPAETGGGSQTNSNIVLFGAQNSITVTEPAPLNGYSLSNLVCEETDINNSTPQPPGTLGPTATIIVEEGEFVTCTFTNTQVQPSAALVSVSGRVTTLDGRGISSVRVTLTDETGGSRMALTNGFGYYRFDDVEVGQTYVITPIAKRYQFNSQVISLLDELTGLDFIALP